MSDITVITPKLEAIKYNGSKLAMGREHGELTIMDYDNKTVAIMYPGSWAFAFKDDSLRSELPKRIFAHDDENVQFPIEVRGSEEDEEQEKT